MFMYVCIYLVFITQVLKRYLIWASESGTTANAAGTYGLTSLPKHGGARDNRFLVTLSITDLVLLYFRNRTPSARRLSTLDVRTLK
jgi:hypothetical protein